MKLIYVALSLSLFINVHQCIKAEKSDLSAAVWNAVTARNSTWTNDDLDGHMELYHPNFRRWTLRSHKLMDKKDFKKLWSYIKRREKVISLEVIPEELIFYANQSVAVAHYSIDELYEWVGNDTSERKLGDRRRGNLRFSDIWIFEKGKWLYAGGHRDGMALPEGYIHSKKD